MELSKAETMSERVKIRKNKRLRHGRRKPKKEGKVRKYIREKQRAGDRERPQDGKTTRK